MTWIMATACGQHVLMGSDTRATGGGHAIDCVQKVHAVGNRLLVGFAGLIVAGYDAVALIRSRDRESDDCGSLIESLPSLLQERSDGSELELLVGWRDADGNGQVARFRSESGFNIEFPPLSWAEQHGATLEGNRQLPLSIGSGSDDELNRNRLLQGVVTTLRSSPPHLFATEFRRAMDFENRRARDPEIGPYITLGVLDRAGAHVTQHWTLHPQDVATPDPVLWSTKDDYLAYCKSQGLAGRAAQLRA